MAKKRAKMSPNGRSRSNRFPVILASGSPRRQQMLTDLRIPFDVFVPSVPEIWTGAEDPAKLARSLARKKVDACRRTDALVIGMDTIVVAGKQMLAKPGNRSEAEAMLRQLSGRMHRVISGVAIRFGQNLLDSSSETKVYFRRLSDEEINWYINTPEPYDKAGGYGIQGLGRIFIKRIDGCYYNVVGFPLACFQTLLARLGFTLLDLRRQGL